jgi:hypothetical protein
VIDWLISNPFLPCSPTRKRENNGNFLFKLKKKEMEKEKQGLLILMFSFCSFGRLLSLFDPRYVIILTIVTPSYFTQNTKSVIISISSSH